MVISTEVCSECSIFIVSTTKVMVAAGTLRQPISNGSLAVEQDGMLLRTEQAVRPEDAVYGFDATGFVQPLISVAATLVFF